MKKIFNIFTAVALALVASTTLTACGDDDEPEFPEKTVKQVLFSTTFYVNQMVLDTYDIDCIANGSEALNFASTPVDMTFSNGEVVAMYPATYQTVATELPVETVLSIGYTLKEGYEVPAKSNFAFASEATVKTVYTDGTSDTYSTHGFSSLSNGILGEKITEYTDYLNKNFSSIKATLSQNGISVE